VIAFLVPQTVLVALAFGTADYAGGRPGGLGGGLFTGLSALVVGFAGGAGAFVAARGLRRAELGQADSLRTAAAPPGVLALGIAVNGLVNGAGPPGALLVLVVAAPAIAAGARYGSWSGLRPG
jgi:hypothetical protein